MKERSIAPFAYFAYFPSFRRALLEGIEDKTASYSSNENTVICDPEKLEAELLDRCGSCYVEVKEVLRIMREYNSSVPSVVLVDLIRSKQEHLKRRAEFEGFLLSQCTFEKGQKYGELGRMYMGRCSGSTRFHCCQEIAVNYVGDLNELIQIEAPVLVAPKKK